MKNKFDSIFDIIKNSLWLIFYNIKSILLFILFYVIFNLVGAICIYILTIRACLLVSNTKYIGPDNIINLLLCPYIWIIILIACILFSFFAIFEIGGLTHAFTMSKLNKKTTFTKMILASINASEKSLLFVNWPIVAFVIILFPLTGISTVSSATCCIHIPEFISDFLIANKLYSILYILFYIILTILVINYIFAFNYYAIGQNNIITSCKKSKVLIKTHYIETIASAILISILFFILSSSTSATISDAYSLIASSANMFFRPTFIEDLQLLLKGFLYVTFAPIFTLSCVTSLFFKYTENENYLEIFNQNETEHNQIKLNKFLWFIIILIFLIGLQIFININILYPKNTNINVPFVVAHRGDSVRAPENTMPAIKLAAEEGNKFIEFDVHQTKDNVIIISHDDNLLRVTGKNVYVHELTYDEIMKLDTGSWFNSRYKNTRFSTLDEALKFLKNYDMTIQIEIKPTGFDNNLEEEVVSIIRNNGLSDRCMITCLKLEPLLKIEKFAPEIYTVYSMFVALENIQTIPVDAYTIEASNVKEELVNNIHNANKKCFAWTLNTNSNVQYMVDCNVDGILTDDPIMMSNALYDCDYEGGIKKAIRYYLYIMIRGL